MNCSESIMKAARWLKLLEFYSDLKTACSKEGMVVTYDGEPIPGSCFQINIEDRFVYFDIQNSRFNAVLGVFDDTEIDCSVTSGTIIREAKQRIKLYQQIDY